MVDFQNLFGYSADNPGVLVGLLELKYKKTKNPMCVWDGVLLLEKIGHNNYPKWIRQYLVQSAKNLKKCDHTPKGMNGIVAAFDLKGTHLYEEDIEKVMKVYELMGEKIASGLSLLEASQVVEEKLDQGGLTPSQRGFWGASKIEKIYRELKKADDEMR